jgi:DnaJ-class molecular chaperone
MLVPTGADGYNEGIITNPYDVLGITMDASERDCRNSHCSQCRKLHPDKCGNTAAFQATNEAYVSLIDPVTREILDRALKKRCGIEPAAPKIEERYKITESEEIELNCLRILWAKRFF